MGVGGASAKLPLVIWRQHDPLSACPETLPTQLARPLEPPLSQRTLLTKLLYTVVEQWQGPQSPGPQAQPWAVLRAPGPWDCAVTPPGG